MRRMTYVACLLFFLGPSALKAVLQQEEPTYQVQSEVTITGSVTRLSLHTGKRGPPRSRATLIVADGTPVEVHIGPSSFVRDKNMELAVGDFVSVIGSRVLSEGAPLVIVRRLTRADRVLDLRNAAGRPLWEDRYK